MLGSKLLLAVAAALVALGLAACDGSENNRTQPTAPAGYISPALRGVEVPKAGSSETKAGEAEPTAEAK